MYVILLRYKAFVILRYLSYLIGIEAIMWIRIILMRIRILDLPFENNGPGPELKSRKYQIFKKLFFSFKFQYS